MPTKIVIAQTDYNSFDSQTGRETRISFIAGINAGLSECRVVYAGKPQWAKLFETKEAAVEWLESVGLPGAFMFIEVFSIEEMTEFEDVTELHTSYENMKSYLQSIGKTIARVSVPYGTTFGDLPAEMQALKRYREQQREEREKSVEVLKNVPPSGAHNVNIQITRITRNDKDN